MMLRQDRPYIAISIMLDIAFHAGQAGGSAGSAEVAQRLRMARRGIEPVFQALSRAGLLESSRGPRGGYRLVAKPREVKLGAIVAAVTETTDPSVEAGTLQTAVVNPLWRELEASLSERLNTLTLQDLIRRTQVAGLRRPASSVINFAI